MVTPASLNLPATNKLIVLASKPATSIALLKRSIRLSLIAVPNDFKFSIGFSKTSLKKSATVPKLLNTKFTKSLMAILVASNAVLKKSAVRWFFINTSLSISNAFSANPIPAALSAIPTPLIPSLIPPVAFAVSLLDLPISCTDFLTCSNSFLASPTSAISFIITSSCAICLVLSR